MAHELAVWLFDDRVGTLSLIAGRLNFCYAPAWLSHPDTVALSVSLPLQPEPFDDRKTRPFFAGWAKGSRIALLFLEKVPDHFYLLCIYQVKTRHGKQHRLRAAWLIPLF